MQSTGRVAYTSDESSDVKIDSLYLEGMSGKIVANIDERMISLETRTGHGLDIKLHTINRIQHHHTRLIPGYVATLGLALVWSGVRIFAASSLQMVTIIGGLSLIVGWAVTRKPTLTIDTEAGDCHVVTGNDFSLLKLNTILTKLQKGFNLEEAADGLEILESDTSYPRNTILEADVVPVELTPINRPESIATFLSSEIAESVSNEPENVPVMDMSIFDTQMPPSQPPTASEPSWQDMASERRERLPLVPTDSLIERGINNVGDRRGRQEAHPMAMFDRMDFDLPSATTGNEKPIIPGPPSSGLLKQINSGQANEAGLAEMPSLLPSFWNKDGYHNPGETPHQEVSTNALAEFSSPDTLLGNIDFEGNEVESLVASARRIHNPNRALPSAESTISHNQNSRLRKKTTANSSRLVKRRMTNNRNSPKRGRLVPAFGNAVRDFGNTLTNRIINTLEESSSATLRERADEAQQEELETFRNLAQSNGGPIPDDKARELEANVRRRNTLMEQNEQDFADSGSDLSWTEMVESEPEKSAASGKGGLPRIDL
tara:strand:+ start:2050 stop:3687 length:1638 start_codon:yes stop_codon:yes gene_type:complete